MKPGRTAVHKPALVRDRRTRAAAFSLDQNAKNYKNILSALVLNAMPTDNQRASPNNTWIISACSSTISI